MKLERRSVGRIVAAGFILFLLIYYYMFSGEIILTSAKPIILGACIAYPLNIMINWFDRYDPLYRKKILKEPANEDPKEDGPISGPGRF